MLRRLSRYVYLQCKLCGRFWLCAASRLQSRRLRGSARNLGCQALALGCVQGASGFCPEVVFLSGTGSWDPQGCVLGVVMQGHEQQSFHGSKNAGKCQELGLPSSCSGLCPGGLRALSGGRLPFRDRVLGSPGLCPGGCHAGT